MKLSEYNKLSKEERKAVPPKEVPMQGCVKVLLIMALAMLLIFGYFICNPSKVEPAVETKATPTKKQTFITLYNDCVNFRVGNYLVNESDILEAARKFRQWDMAIFEATQLADKTLGDTVKLFTEMAKEKETFSLPVLRKKYTELKAAAVWRDNMYIRVAGKKSDLITYTSHKFADNAKVEDFHNRALVALGLLKFKQARYEWYKGSEYVYYDIK